MEVNGLNNNNANTSNVSGQSSPSPAPTISVQSAPQVVASESKPTVEVNMTTGEQTGNGVRSHVREAINEEVERQLKDMISEINSRMQSNTEISYSIHSKSSKLNIKIIDKASKEVIKEWPSEKSLDLLAKMFEQQAVMLDKKL